MCFAMKHISFHDINGGTFVTCVDLSLLPFYGQKR